MRPPACIFVVFQQVDDVSGLLYVVDMGEHLFLCIFVEVSYQVDSVVGVEVVDIFFGDGFARQFFEEFLTVVLIEFHQHIGRGFLVEQFIEKLGLFDVEILIQFGDVGRVQVFQ